ncbi:hypothetical protein ACMYR3_10665 [Ampullimonas aquatilis]|uniref:hypothetical protein n=1 Tax=Ampullimonas aquatilis TaxID=1341549 RepID=UPI003C71A449
MKHDQIRTRTLQEIFAVPALLALLSSIGLISALLADGLWDALSWLSLGGVVAATIWYALRRHDRSTGQPD